ALPPTTMALSIYCTSITVFFVLIKLANYRLHLMFDEGEAVVRNSLSDLSKAQEKKSNASDSCQPPSIRRSSTLPDSVAMTTLARKRPSPVIQVTVKQTETDPGLIGVDKVLWFLNFYTKSFVAENFQLGVVMMRQGETAAEEQNMEGGPLPNPELSPDDLSSPNPEQDAPLLRAQQRSPSRPEKEQAEVTETGAAVGEGRDVQKSLIGKGGDQSEEERSLEKDLKQDTREEKESEYKEAADRETVDEGLPASKGREDESEEGSEGPKENSDANNNSLETPKDDLDVFIDTPESPAQVGSTAEERAACCHI
ncbi:hypothetical protein XENOCAPTIV_006653, partial [Xenoophorus captivus]